MDGLHPNVAPYYNAWRKSTDTIPEIDISPLERQEVFRELPKRNEHLERVALTGSGGSARIRVHVKDVV